MDFKWTINKLTVAADNLVVKVDLTITGTDGDNSASAAEPALPWAKGD